MKTSACDRLCTVTFSRLVSLLLSCIEHHRIENIFRHTKSIRVWSNRFECVCLPCVSCVAIVLLGHMQSVQLCLSLPLCWSTELKHVTHLPIYRERAMTTTTSTASHVDSKWNEVAFKCRTVDKPQKHTRAQKRHHFKHFEIVCICSSCKSTDVRVSLISIEVGKIETRETK